MNEKWNTRNRICYLKIQAALKIITTEILALEVTDEKVHDSKILKKLVNNVLDNQDKKKIKSALADDGAMIQIQTSDILRRKRSLLQ